MSFYDSLSSLTLSDEKNVAVIFDFGYAYTKVGFAGESSPRAIVKSEVKSRQTQKLVPLFEFENEDQLIEQLVDFIHPLYFTHLLINSINRRIVVVENILGSYLKKTALAAVFFKYYGVISLCFVPSHLVSLMTLGIDTALVVDIGYEEATVIPIYGGVHILNAWEAVPCASRLIHRSLCELLLDRALCTDKEGNEERLSSAHADLSEQELEDMKVRCCFVSTLQRSDKLQLNKIDRSNEPPAPPPSCTYPLKGDRLLTIPGTVRELAAESLFEMDQDLLSLASIILHSIIKCPVDTRRDLANNLLIIGGTASMQGLKSRLLAEVRHLASKPPFSDSLKFDSFKIHLPPVKDNCVAWMGGAIFGCTEAIVSSSITRDAFAESGIVPDWSTPKED